MNPSETASRIRLHGMQGCLGLGMAAWLACSACSMSPKPEPPGPGIELGLVTTHDTGTLGPKAIVGGPGAASPAGAVVRAFNLELPDDPAEGSVQADGSFEIEMLLFEGDEARLQVHWEQSRSAPVDVVIGPDDTSPTLAQRALGDCLLLEPGAEVDVAVTGAVRVVNHCGAAVTLAEPYLRRPIIGMEIGQGSTWPLSLTPEASVDVAVQFDGGAGASEEIAFIEATDPDSDRRPITVWPQAP